MIEEKELTGWERSRAAQKGYGNFYAGLAIATVFIAGVWIGSRVFATSDDPNSSGFFLNLWTEALGILVTVGLFGLISQHLAEQRYKRQLVNEAASRSNGISKHAVHMIKRQTWLTGAEGILQGQDLQGADLSDVDLREANLYKANLSNVTLNGAILVRADLREAKLAQSILKKANLVQANLQAANMRSADLSGAWLKNVKLQKADLASASMHRAKVEGARAENVNLEGAILSKAYLEGTDLSGATLLMADLRASILERVNLKNADLRGAVLQGANLFGANLEGAKLSIHPVCDSTTIMPDENYWSPDVDWKRFTDPMHESFWRSDDPASPAYSKEVSITVFSEE